MPPSSTIDERARVQIAVGGERLLQRFLRWGEARRIGDDEAVAAALAGGALEPGEGVLGVEVVARGIEAVEREVGARVGERGAATSTVVTRRAPASAAWTEKPPV